MKATILRKYFHNSVQAEHYWNRLQNKYDNCEIVQIPLFTEAGNYIFRVTNH